MANFLSRNGYCVHTLSVKRSEKFNLLSLEKNITQHFISTGIEIHNHPGSRKLDFTVRAILKWGAEQFGYIDILQLSIRKYFNEARKIIKKYSIDTVIISSPPHSLQLLVPRLRRHLPELRIISDLRDPWALRKCHNSNSSEQTEKTVLREADSVLVVSSYMEAYYKESLGDNCVVVTVENGFVKSNPMENILNGEGFVESPDSNRIMLGYFGSGVYSKSSNLGKNFSILFDFFSRHYSLAKRFHLVIQGGFKAYEDIPQTALEVTVKNPVEHNAAVLNMTKCDICFQIYTDKNDAPMVMGGKIYDYIEANVPILLLAPENSHSMKLFSERHKQVLFADIFSESSLCDVFEMIVDEFDSRTLVERIIPPIEANHYLRDNQYKKILSLLET